MGKKLFEWLVLICWFLLLFASWNLASIDGVLLVFFLTPVSGFLALALVHEE